MNIRDHLEKLRYFYEVARLGSMKKASESIFITQPSLTKSIKILEESIGSPLFTRLPRGVKVTKEGEILYEFCHNLFASIKDIEQRLSHPDDPLSGSLRIGTYDSLASFFWPKFLKTFLPQYPQMNFEMTTGRSNEMQEMLEAGELDLILVVEPKPTSEIATEVLLKDTFKFYVTTKVKKAYSSNEDAPLIIMPKALAGRNSIEDVFRSYNLEKRKRYNNSSLESVKELTLNGIGAGLLPQRLAKQDVEKKKLKEVNFIKIPKKGIGEHSIGVAYQIQRKESPLIKVLIKELRQYKW